MSIAKVLIKFISTNPSGNVISASALEPEILILVGYGNFLTDTMRSRYNYYFHRRRIQTIVGDPIQLERYLMGDIENRLEALLTRYESRRPIVDISDADAIESMALGSVLRAHKFWSVTVLDYSIPDSFFFPLKNGDYLKQLTFPSLTSAEMAYLRDGTAMDAPPDNEDIFYRKDLSSQVIKEIRALSVLYAESPAFWRDTVSRFRYAVGTYSEGKTEFMIDAASMGIRETAFEELRDVGILRLMGKQNGIVRLIFQDQYALRLFLHVQYMPIMNVFLSVALIRAYGSSAAFNDLMLHDYKYITGLRGAMPLVLQLFNEQQDTEQIYRFHDMASGLFDEPVRKILVRFSPNGLDMDLALAAERFGVEIVSFKQLTMALEPK